MQTKYKVDVAGFGNQLRIKQPRTWMRVKGNWDQTFSEVPINYDVKLTIKGYGASGSKSKHPTVTLLIVMSKMKNLKNNNLGTSHEILIVCFVQSLQQTTNKSCRFSTALICCYSKI